MRILVTSFVFAPLVGGVQTLTDTLAREFACAGNEVTVVTETPFDGTDIYPYKVVRRPDRAALKRLIAWSDVVWQNNVSVRLGWPLLLSRRPVVITHGGFQAARSPVTLSVMLQKMLCHRSYNISVSRNVAASIPGRGEPIGNPYGADFGLIEGIERTRDVAFVGRVVSEKGPDVLMNALVKLKKSGTPLSATIVGDGLLRDELEEIAKREALDVVFTGALDPPAIARELNAHLVLAVPSVWEEPFGIVALEGLACGCRLVASNRGGLPEAAGPGAVLFDITEPPDEASSERLADAIFEALDHKLTSEEDAAVKVHLNAHSAATIGARYLEIFAREIKGGKK